MKRIAACLLTAVFLASWAAADGPSDISAKSVFLMEAGTGQVLYEENSLERLPIASVTKIMTLLLICEAMDKGTVALDTQVTASAYAAGMGGSQIYLKEGETMPLEDMLKSVVIASANDAAVALAEQVSGSEASFVAEMNLRAEELGLENTHFENCTGLPAENHYSCARDVAVMSCRLLRHDEIKNYTTVWMDTVRDGEFTLTNTNKMIRSYKGLIGLKTGYTAEAGFCVSAAASRDGMELIAVVLGSQTGAVRFASAASLLDYGFANWVLTDPSEGLELPQVEVELGEQEAITPRMGSSAKLLAERRSVGKLETRVDVAPSVRAPVEAGTKLGEITVTDGDNELLRVQLVAPEDVAKVRWHRVFSDCLERLFMRG